MFVHDQLVIGINTDAGRAHDEYYISGIMRVTRDGRKAEGLPVLDPAEIENIP
jgi:hypothetical protein